MQTITKNYKVYEFEELSEEAQEKVLADNNQINIDYWEWWHNVYDIWEEKLEEMGYTNPKINFSGFWSQGDGASFECNIDLERWLKARKLTNKHRAIYRALKRDAIAYKIVQSGHYSHEMTMGIELYFSEENEEVYMKAEKVRELILDDARTQARLIYKELEEEYNFLTSKEVLTDTIRSNEWKFLEDGTMFNE